MTLAGIIAPELSVLSLTADTSHILSRTGELLADLVR